MKVLLWGDRKGAWCWGEMMTGHQVSNLDTSPATARNPRTNPYGAVGMGPGVGGHYFDLEDQHENEKHEWEWARE